MAPIRRNLSQPLSASEFDGKERRTARKIKRKTKGFSKTARNTRKYIKLQKKRDKLESQVESLKPKSNASGFNGKNSKTYIYNDPRFKEMGRDKRGNKIKKTK